MLMALLQLSKNYMSLKVDHQDKESSVSSSASDFKQFYATMIIMSSTSALLKGISFRLSALNRLSQKQGALVASLYFEVSGMQLIMMNDEMEKMKKKEKSKSSHEDEDEDSEEKSKSIVPPKFDQFPNLLQEYLHDERTVWSMVAENCILFSNNRLTKNEKKKVTRDDEPDDMIIALEEKTNAVKEMLATKHRAISSGSAGGALGESQNDGESESAVSKYWFLPKVVIVPPLSEARRILHPQIHSQQVIETLQRTKISKSINMQNLKESAGSLKNRFSQEQHRLSQLSTKRSGGELVTRNVQSPNSEEEHATTLFLQERAKMRKAVSSLRELEVKLTNAETNSTNSTITTSTTTTSSDKNQSPMDQGEEAMKELPLVLEKIFTRNRTISLTKTGAFHEQVRTHAADPAVVVRLFMLSIASSFAGIKGEVSVAAASSAGWCVALMPGTILVECDKVLNGADFALVHKLRCLNAIQVGMSRLANAKIVDGTAMIMMAMANGDDLNNNQRNKKNRKYKTQIDDGGVDEKEGETSRVIYPPLPGSKQPFMNYSSSSSSTAATSDRKTEGTIRWKSAKLSQEYKEREQVSKSSIYRNDALQWATLAIETVLLIKDRIPSIFSSQQQQQNHNHNQNSTNIKIPRFGEDNADEDGEDIHNNKKKPGSDNHGQGTFKLLQVDPDGGLTLECIRTVTLIVEFVSRSNFSQVMESIAKKSLECLFTLATSHFLPAVRINALVCLSAVLKFPETRRTVLFSNTANMFDKLTTALFLSGVSKMANEDPDSNVRFVAKDLTEMLLLYS